MKKDNFRGLARKIALFSLIAFSTPVFSIGFSYLDQGGTEQLSSRSSYRRLNQLGGAFGIFPSAVDQSRHIMGLYVAYDPTLGVARRCNILFLGIKYGRAIGLTTFECLNFYETTLRSFAYDYDAFQKFYIPNTRSQNLVIKAKDTIITKHIGSRAIPIEQVEFFDWSNRPTDAMLDYSKDIVIEPLYDDLRRVNRLALVFGAAVHREDSRPDTLAMNVHLGSPVLTLPATYSYLSWGDQPVRVSSTRGGTPSSAIVGDSTNPGYKFLSAIPVAESNINNYQPLSCYGDMGGVEAAQTNPSSGFYDGIVAVITDSVSSETHRYDRTPSVLGGVCHNLSTGIPLSDEDINRIVYLSELPNP